MACNSPSTDPIEPEGRISGEVTWIADGDTLEVDTGETVITVRLAGINAPENGECFADESLDYLIDNVKGQTVTIEELEIDQFGRTLAHVFTESNHVNLDLVEFGLVIANGIADDPYGALLVTAEGNAFDSRSGLWSPTACGSSGDLPMVNIRDTSTVDPGGPDDEALDAEQIVIVSASDEPVDLSGWILRDESSRHRFAFAEGTILTANGDELRISSSDPGWDPGGSPVWSNSGDMALLQLPDGTVVDRWRYR